MGIQFGEILSFSSSFMTKWNSTRPFSELDKKVMLIALAIISVFAVIVSSACFIYFRFKSISKDRDKMNTDRDQLLKDQDQLAKDRNQLNRDREQLSKDQDQLAKDRDQLAKDRNQLEEDREVVSTDLVPQEQPAQVQEEINVPDDGNCLFSAIAISLLTTYENDVEIKKKLQWEQKPGELTDDLIRKGDFIETLSTRLREQAAEYLSAHKDDAEVVASLFGAITDHNEVAERKIEEEEMAIQVLEEDENQLVAWKKGASGESLEEIERQLKQKRDQLEIKRMSVEFEKAHLASDDDLEGYIKLSREKGFYCGTAQLIALSKLYEIPITVIRDNGMEEPFNSIQGRKPIKIGFKNGNHFTSLRSG